MNLLLGRLIRAVLKVRDFRKLWASMALSSFGDWLGLLAITATATSLVDTFASKNFALGAVLLFLVGAFKSFRPGRLPDRAGKAPPTSPGTPLQGSLDAVPIPDNGIEKRTGQKAKESSKVLTRD